MGNSDGIINFFLGIKSFPAEQGSIFLISKWYFESGDFVKKGDELLEVQSEYTKRKFIATAEQTGIIEIINENSKYLDTVESLIYSIHTDYDDRLK